MATIKAPARLPELVKAAFAKALHEGDLSYFPTHVQDVRVGALSFQLRFSPSLANKPKAPPKQQGTTSSPSPKPFDPFAYTSPPPRLFVADVGAAHFLVLNKFAIVPEHFILATRDFKPQTHVLDADDLYATLACIRAYEEGSSSSSAHGGGALFAFFNCGAHSGASQPHRHIQLLPVAAMREGLPENSAWSVLASRLDGDDGAVAPFRTFSDAIGLDTSREDLHTTYLRLYEQAVRAAAAAKDDEPAAAKSGEEAAVSYNMAMTRDRLVLCPRLAEGGSIMDPDTGDVVGQVSLNGTMLAGTALVKTEAEWDALRRSPRALTAVLKSVGVAQPHFVEENIKL
ncbi:Histidine triad-like motif protein [Akanthomyces lecanii RCEF 1005]|uniref:Histidine triad-like motif protein n=1 Tax=Akanthomyces lecanii RCEF 1005 TaxID=1081108 RepID=A0A162KGC2_CORDF|nr:Histidine triad-like motif protein [Akanthomyces lecanii RCEF 1005]